MIVCFTSGLFGASLSLEFLFLLSLQLAKLFVLLAQDMLVLLHLSKNPSLRWNCCGTRSASADSQTPAFARGTVSTTMAIHGSQYRALMLETISHAQRVTSDAPHPTYHRNSEVWKLQNYDRNSSRIQRYRSAKS